MADRKAVKKLWKRCMKLEAAAHTAINSLNAPVAEVAAAIEEYRLECQNLIFLDIEFAGAVKAEGHLWDVHSAANNTLRKALGKYNQPENKKNHVERRKFERVYADFLKISSRYYKCFVQRLASQYDLPHLRAIAARLNVDLLSADIPSPVDGLVAQELLLLCHSVLLRLGDLARYRNVIRLKHRSWDVALAYYSLANDLRPESGLAFNQMAVIYTLDADHLLIIYYLFRALTVEQPNSIASGNVSLQFKKIIDEWTGAKEPQKNSAIKYEPLPLILWFVRLHAKIYNGEQFMGHDDLENEFLGQFSVALTGKTIEDMLDKFILINIAAEYFAGKRIQNNPSVENLTSFEFYLRLNIRTLSVLLQILQSELNKTRDPAEDVDVNVDEHPGNLTEVICRILPALRHYSTWLITRAVIIVLQSDNENLSAYIAAMWNSYTCAANKLVAVFPPERLPVIDYLLDEDAQTFGFKPFRDSEQCMLYTTEDIEGNTIDKPRSSAAGIVRESTDVEMQARIRDLLRDCMVLATDPNTPINLTGDNIFVYTEVDKMEEGSIVEQPQNDMQGTSRVNNTTAQNSQPDVPARPSSVTPSDANSMSTDMYRMVDKLVNPATKTVPAPQSSQHTSNETSYGMHSLTANELFIQNPSSTPMSRQGSISNSLFFGADSAFSPRPGELPGTEHLASGMRSKSSSQHNSPGAATDAQAARRTWGEAPAWHAGTSHSPLSRVKQQKQGRQQNYTMPSSAFSHASSVYGGTPAYGSGTGPLGKFGLGHVPRRDEEGVFVVHDNGLSYAGLDDVDNEISSVGHGSLPAYHPQHATSSYAQNSQGLENDNYESSAYANTSYANAVHTSKAYASMNNQYAGTNHSSANYGSIADATTTLYGGASTFENDAMLQSSIWNGSQPALGAQNGPFRTPPGGQGG